MHTATEPCSHVVVAEAPSAAMVYQGGKTPTVPQSIPHSRIPHALHGSAPEVLRQDSPESKAAKNLELPHQTVTRLTAGRN